MLGWMVGPRASGVERWPCWEAQYDLALNYVGAVFRIVPLSTVGRKFVRSIFDLGLEDDQGPNFLPLRNVEGVLRLARKGGLILDVSWD
jgi:hypothetical protein